MRVASIALQALVGLSVATAGCGGGYPDAERPMSGDDEELHPHVDDEPATSASSGEAPDADAGDPTDDLPDPKPASVDEPLKDATTPDAH